MNPEIVEILKKKLIGLNIKTSLSFDDTAALWKNFVSRLSEIKNKKDNGYYSIQVYPKSLKMEDFTEETVFERWAAVEVESFEEIPHEMKTKVLEGGTYAVFTHVGPVKTFVETSNYIYSKWLPNSDFLMDDRAHFERLGEKYYGPEHPESEEQLWVPIKRKICEPKTGASTSNS